MSIVKVSRIVVTGLFCLALIAAFAGCGAEQPKAAEKPAPKPVAKPKPKPVEKPAPKPVEKPKPKPVAKPAPKPVDKPKPKPLGYQNTPLIPGTKWHVHDGLRPQPKIVTPEPPAGPVPPPAGAIVLFDGKDLSKWKNKKWKLEDGAMSPTKGGQSSVDSFGDILLHIEWASPKIPRGSGQGRGNSGVYLMGRYEIQVLDSYNNKTYPDGQAAAIYGQYPPMVNACRPPGEWQTYDITFIAPRFKDGKLVSPAIVTVVHNGIVVHDKVKILGPTAHKRIGKYTDSGPTGPINLQHHGNPVRYRNIWIKPLK